MTTKTSIHKDSDLRQSVQAELDWDPGVDTTGIVVRVEKGIVTLSGVVETYAKKVAAVGAAHRILGVLDVVDELQVRIPGQPKTDLELAEAVRNALVWDVYVPDKRIQSTVSEGWVTLEGDVDLWHQRDVAVQAVERLGGVRGVTNRIVVCPSPVDAARLHDSIEDALARRAEREAKRIRVRVREGVVEVTGSVHSWAEKNAIERLVTYTPGVRRIENKIVVDPYA